MGSALYQNLFRGKKKDTDTRENWNDNPIPEDDKVKHPEFAKAMKAIKGYNNFKAKDDGRLGGVTQSQKNAQRDKFFKDSLQTPSITYNGKSYSLQSLVPD